MFRPSLHQAIVGALAAALLAGLIPAGFALDRRLAGALEERARRDLELAPRIFASRTTSVTDAMMMHAKDLAHTPGLAGALARGDSLMILRLVTSAQTAFSDGFPIVISRDGMLLLGPRPAARLLDATREGKMPVGLSTDRGVLHNIALAPVQEYDVWLGAVGFASPVDEHAAATLAGITRSDVVVLLGDTVSASTLDSAAARALSRELAALPVDGAAHEVASGGRRRIAIATRMGGGASTYFLRSIDAELAVLPELRRVTLFSAIGALMIALTLGALFAARVSSPAGQLATAAVALSRGAFDAPLPSTRVVEMSQLAGSFDDMRRALAARLEELRAANVALGDRNARLSALQSDLMQRNRHEATGRLVAQLAHEIRNPIANLRNCLEIVNRRVENDPQAREFTELAIDELLRMHELAEQMLDMQRPRDPAVRECAPVRVAREVARLVTAGVSTEQLRVTVSGDESVRAAIAGDALKQVLINLIQNAREAVQLSAHAPALIAVRIAREGDGVALEIEDNGPGVPVALRSRIFDPFFTTKEAVQGVGLGLYVAEGLVRSAGGRIGVDTAPRGGGRFRIDLPAAMTESLVEVAGATIDGGVA
jgi:signal transduction histidine kinase